MREIKPKLTKEIERHCNGQNVWRARPFHVATFRELVRHVAKLSYINHDELLFFRGQDKDFQSKSGGTTLYPSIYRGDPVPARELQYRFSLLEDASNALVRLWKSRGYDGFKDIRRKKYIKWSILQHYGVVDTPLIDVTHSLRVACSFAQLKSTNEECYVYVLGLPHITNRITVNSEHDLVNIRLLSICPPDALRPYFQEGYLSGTVDILTDFDSKTELDFRNRLVAKFAIPIGRNFWGSGFHQIPEDSLFPTTDKVSDLCKEISGVLGKELGPTDIGNFIKEWTVLENGMLALARRKSERNLSFRNSIKYLHENKILDEKKFHEIDKLRKFRNKIVHQNAEINLDIIHNYLNVLNNLMKDRFILENVLNNDL